MTKIYSQHDAAFSRFSSFAIIKSGKPVATVAIKFPADGAGRLYAYVHVLGTEMVRGYADGYGYDKRSAAVSAACEKLLQYTADDSKTWPLIARTIKQMRKVNDGGSDWTRQLEDMKFRVFQTA